MASERRFAIWRSPGPAVPITVQEIVGSFRTPTKHIVAFSLILVVVLLVIFPDLYVFLSLLTLICISACAIPLATIYAKRHFTGHQAPLPTYDHGDNLERMNVTLRLEVDGHVYGEDRGEITLVDDWLIFEGARTSFSISRADAESFKLMPDVRKQTQFALNLRGLGAKVRMRLISDQPYEYPSVFLTHWCHRTANNVGTGILPPLEPMPKFRRGLGIWLNDRPLIFSGPLAVLTVANMLFRHSRHELAGVEVCLVVSTLALVWAMYSRRKALHALAITREKNNRFDPALEGASDSILAPTNTPLGWKLGIPEQAIPQADAKVTIKTHVS